MKRLLLAVTAAASLAGGATALAGGGLDRIELPNGFRPEGIAPAGKHSVLVGSIPTGQVLRVNTKTGERTPVVPGGQGRAAIGLKQRGGRIFVSGGPTGKAFVYDARTGQDLAQFTLATGNTFINDVAIGGDEAFFTDSRAAVIHAVRRDLSGAREIKLEGFPLVSTPATTNNLNGIVAAKGGRWLLAVQSNDGSLWRIDSVTGAFSKVDLGGTPLTNGDGLLLIRKRVLLAVQNRLNQVAVVKLNKEYTAGRVVRTVPVPQGDVPTTIARVGKAFYLPNARFTTPPTATTPYWISRLDLKVKGGERRRGR